MEFGKISPAFEDIPTREASLLPHVRAAPPSSYTITGRMLEACDVIHYRLPVSCDTGSACLEIKRNGA